MDKQVAERDLPWMGDDDWTGLWEAPWSIQTLWPELTGEPAVEAAHSVLRDLLGRGMIYLCYLDSDTNAETVLRLEEAYELMELRESWNTPESPKRQLRFATTPRGEKEMYRLEAALMAPGKLPRS